MNKIALFCVAIIFFVAVAQCINVNFELEKKFLARKGLGNGRNFMDIVRAAKTRNK